ncbi:MAG: Fe-S cluster assembly protein HesB [Sphingobacteriales bacterium]|nr:MAG: Fe-S cluster assembly protein HesB [Sphingobacteriales bacterium]
MPVASALAPNQNTAFVLQVHYRLAAVYGSGLTYFHNLDPLSELVSSLLSHRTKNSQSAQAYHNLVAQFPSWQAVLEAPVAAVEAAISPCTWPEQKAPRLKQVLQEIHTRTGALSLEFLGELPVAAAREWLEQLPGVGPKTSAAVLSFSTLRARALPVDSHHFRVAVRLGIILEKIGEGKANRVLEQLLPDAFSAQDVYDHHQFLMRHGQKICHWRSPECRNCVLLDICPTGQLALLK